ncbi:hypothetical protein BPULL_1871 [Bifidobacterium pullorum]|uniref:Uncharacterized protein n=1 Tax=Bifidobacterium pullorum TaxID=78448 RepID=A0A7V8HS00_9BIFI|nr:hypothetical protein BPULL_1871 [Bifidobacterium pullorum]
MSSFSQAGGSIIRMACGRLRPARCSSSRHSSKVPESEYPGVAIGSSGSNSPSSSELRRPSRACSQLRLPWMVLISPLWASRRKGWASGQLGNVLVEKRECTMATRAAIRSSLRSGKNPVSCMVVSMPL